MTWLFENPLPILIMGGLTLAIIAGGWFQTQRKELVIAFIAALVVFGGALVLERSIVTDGEQVELVIAQIAREAEANDAAALAKHFHSSAGDMRSQLSTEMAVFQVKKVSIKSNLKVIVDPRALPKRAVATFNVVATITDKTGTFKEQPIPRFVTANFELEDGQWRCIDYKHEDPQRGMQIRD